jgi:ubiquinone/menaquinone biosynthesis C-methylase UbiE
VSDEAAVGMDDAARDADYVLGRSQDEYDRLIEQGMILAPATERVLRAAGVGPGMRVLDVGCGVGDVARLVGELLGGDGEVVGVDVDEAALGVAKGRLGHRGVRFLGVAGDFRSVNVGDSFDAACCRMVLQYQADATEAIAAMARHVRVGGVVVAHEIAPQFTGVFADPMFPLAEQVNSWIGAAYASSGGNHLVGGELGRRFAEAGLVPADQPLVETICALGDSAMAARRFRTLLLSLLPVLVGRNIASEADLDLATFEERFRAEAGAMGSTVVLWPALVGWWARRI